MRTGQDNSPPSTIKIDIAFDFTTDTPNYWHCFYTGELINDVKL